MNKKLIWIEPVLLGMFGILLTSISLAGNLLDILNWLRPSSKWDLYFHGLEQLVLTYALVFLSICLLSIYLVLSRTAITLIIWEMTKKGIRSIGSYFNNIAQSKANPDKNFFLILMIIMVGVSSRIFFLDQPIRADEAYSFLHHTYRDLSSLFYYDRPNNHVLHNILAKLSISIWGPSVVSFRIPAFIAGVGLIPATYTLSRKFNQSGLVAAVLIAISPYLVFYSTNSRGYMLISLITVFLIMVGLKTSSDGPSINGSVKLSMLSALGLFAIPTTLYGIAGVYLWILISLIKERYPFKRVFFEYLVFTGVLTGVFTILLYTPVVIFSNGYEGFVAYPYIQRQPFSEVFSGLVGHFNLTWQVMTQDVPIIVLITCVVLFVVGLFWSLKKKDYRLVLLLLSILIGGMMVLLITSRIPFPRSWIYLIPIFAVVVDAGYSKLVKNWSRTMMSILSLMIISFGTFFTLDLIVRNPIGSYRETGYFPEAEIAVKYLETRTNEEDRVYMGPPGNSAVRYYIIMNDMPIRYYDWKDNQFRNIYYIVQKSEYSIDQMTEEPVREIFDYQDLEIYIQVKE